MLKKQLLNNGSHRFQTGCSIILYGCILLPRRYFLGDFVDYVIIIAKNMCLGGDWSCVLSFVGYFFVISL